MSYRDCSRSTCADLVVRSVNHAATSVHVVVGANRETKMAFILVGFLCCGASTTV